MSVFDWLGPILAEIDQDPRRLTYISFSSGKLLDSQKNADLPNLLGGFADNQIDQRSATQSDLANTKLTSEIHVDNGAESCAGCNQPPLY